MKSGITAKNLVQSGLVFSAINFLTGLGNFAFLSVMGNNLPKAGQFSETNSALNAFLPLLGLPPLIATMAVTHYVAHYNAIGDTARLQGLLAGCRKFLFQLTIYGSILAIVMVKPLNFFFHYPASILALQLVCTLLGLWTSLVTALCQGLSWFKRLAFVGFMVMVLKVVFGYSITRHWQRPEVFFLAIIFSISAYLILLFWRKELSISRAVRAIPPWNHEFVLYLVVSGAYVVGNYCFATSDLLVMQRNFSMTDSGDSYTAAERLAVALPTTVAPLLTVLFTNRSAAHSVDSFRAQMKLIGLYAAGLVFGAVCLFFLRHLCLHVLHKDTPAAADMIQRLSVAMVFVGLLQAMGTWALASRWTKIALLYGVLGIAYSVLIFTVGSSAEPLVRAMPVAAGVAFTILFVVWMGAMRRHKPVV